MFRYATVSPAGGFPSPWAIASTARLYRLCLRRKSFASEQLPIVLAALSVSPGTAIGAERGTAQRRVFVSGSGKASLSIVLSALRDRSASDLLLIPAYTCPDVAAAALRAGFKPHLMDLDSGTMELRPESLPDAVLNRAAGVVITNLFGCPDSLAFWRRLRERREDFFVVDDACQAFQSSEGTERVGARGGTFGVLSFGRGKSICAQGGGAVLAPDDADREILDRLQALNPQPRRSADLRTHAFSFLSWFFERPLFYTLPASTPGLHLGETICDLDIRIDGISEAQALAALSLLGGLARDADLRTEKMLRYETLFARQSGVSLPTLKDRAVPGSTLPAPLRFPVIVSGRDLRDRMLTTLRRDGLGASQSYPKVLPDFPEFDGMLTFDDIQGARSVAERLFTLPVHRYVTEPMQRRIMNRLRAAMEG